MKTLNSSDPRFFDNTEKDHIIVTPCRLENLLHDFKEGVRYKGLLLGSLGIFVTVLVALVTSDFRDVFGIPKAGWQGAFVTLFIVSFVITIYLSYKAYQFRYFNLKYITNKLLFVEYKNKVKK